MITHQAFTAALLGTLFVTTVQANEDLQTNETNEDTDVLDTVVVSATRWETIGIPTASSITVITRDQIIGSGADRIIDVLKGQGGLQVQDLFGDGSRSTIDMRGFGSTGGFNTLILVDGRRLNNTDLSAPRLNHIFLKDVERIEITQGAGTVLYGDQAVGGVVNIITRQPDKFVADIDAGYGSYDSQSQILTVSNRFENGIGILASAERSRSDGYRDNNKSDYKNGFLNLSFDWSRGSVFTELQRTDEDLGLPGSLFADEIAVSRRQTKHPDDFNESISEALRFGGSYSITPYWDFAGEFTLRDDDVKGALTAFGVTLPLQQKRLVKSYNPRFRGFVPAGSQTMTLIVGADIEDTDYSLVSPFGVQNTTQDMLSVYSLATLPVNEVIAITGGIRKAWQETEIIDFFRFFPGNELKDNQTASSLGVTVTPGDALRFFMKREDVYRFPLVDEETSVFLTPSTLETQTGVSYEFGADWHNTWLLGKITGYVLNLENEIIFNPVTFENTNLDPTKRNGIIYEIGIFPGDNFSFDAQYSYTRAEFKEGPFDGNRIPLVAEHQFHMTLSYRFMTHWSFYGELFLISDRIAGSDFADTFPDLPGYGVSNLNLRFDNNEIFLSAQVNNILDKEYSDSASVGLNAVFVNEVGFFPAPERNFMITGGIHF